MANSKTPAQVVAAARSQAKITTPELIEHLFDDFLNYMVIVKGPMILQS